MGYYPFEHRSCVTIQPLYRDTMGWKVGLVEEKEKKIIIINFKKNQIKSNKGYKIFEKNKIFKNEIFVDKNALNVELIALHDL